MVALSPLLVLIALAVVWALYKKSKELPPDQRAFSYWLTVQKMRDDKPYQDEFQASGQEIFETGYKFRLNIQSGEAGYLYLFNDGPPDTDGTSFTIIYPTLKTNSGSASVSADQSVRTNWNTFKGEAGTEQFWIVWAAAPIPELESAKDEALKRPNGALTGQALMSVKEFLNINQPKSKSRVTTNTDGTVTTVRGLGDVIVRQVKFQHR